MSTNNNVKLTINESCLIKNLSAVFTDKTKVLIELAQNARRSTSEYVHFNYEEETSTLTVKDGGCGIDDLQNLFSIALSGWDNKVKANESAYGMGFLSTLFTCERIEITSGLNKLSATTESILNQDELLVTTLEESEKVTGTFIKLYGFHSSLDDIKEVMTGIAYAYPIKISFNFERLLSPRSIEVLSSSYDACEFEFGTLYFSKHYFSKAFNCYLQGVHILNSNSDDKDLNGVFVHLKSEIKARMPDRDKLLEEDVVKKSIQNSISGFYKRKLSHLLKNMDEKKFMDEYDEIVVKYHPELLNKISFFPRSLFSSMTSTPSLEGFCNDKYLERPRTFISKEELVDKKCFLVDVNIPRDSEDGFKQMMYAYLLNAYVIDVNEVSKTVSSEHWVFDFITELKNHNVSIEVNNEGNSVFLSGHMIHDTIVFCDSYTLKGSLGSVTSDDEAISLGEGDLYLPKSCNDGTGVNQLSSYRGEFDDDLDDLRDLDANLLYQVILRNKAKSKAEFLTLALDVLKSDVKEALKGGEFLLSFDPEGNVSVIENS